MKIVIKLLIQCLYLLMDIRKDQTGSHYSFTNEEQVIKEARNHMKGLN
jgi:hypothetical protein